MKFFTMFFLSLCILNSAHASSNQETILESIDKKIIEINTENRVIELQNRSNTSQLSNLDTKKSILLKASLNAYDYMKSKAMNERYIFMYSLNVIMASSTKDHIDTAALKAWIAHENGRVVKTGIHPDFYSGWNKHALSIKSHIADIESAQTKLAAFHAPKSILNDQHHFLSQLRNDVSNLTIMRDTVSLQAAANLKQLAPPLNPTEDRSLSYLILFLCSLLSLAVGFFLKRKDPNLPLKFRDEAPFTEMLPALPDDESEAFAAVNTFEKVSLEEECRKLISENGHLIELSQVQIHPSPISPFKTNIYAPVDKVSDALNWLLKGTLAIVNVSGSRASHLEWKCHENAGRVSVDFIIHGIECDYKSLYFNTIVEGEASAPAHFGRSEMVLDGHLPVVQFKTGNKRTIITLGLDSSNNSISH
jgi:hypothetical protein